MLNTDPDPDTQTQTGVRETTMLNRVLSLKTERARANTHTQRERQAGREGGREGGTDGRRDRIHTRARIRCYIPELFGLLNMRL